MNTSTWLRQFRPAIFHIKKLSDMPTKNVPYICTPLLSFLGNANQFRLIQPWFTLFFFALSDMPTHFEKCEFKPDVLVETERWITARSAHLVCSLKEVIVSFQNWQAKTSVARIAQLRTNRSTIGLAGLAKRLEYYHILYFCIMFIQSNSSS